MPSNINFSLSANKSLTVVEDIVTKSLEFGWEELGFLIEVKWGARFAEKR